MKRSVAVVLLLVIIAGIWALFALTSFPQLLSAKSSPVLFTYDDTSVTLATLLWLALIIPAWIGLIALGYSIDPILGYYIFRIGYYLIMIILLRQKDSDSSSSRSGSGSGRSGRGS